MIDVRSLKAEDLDGSELSELQAQIRALNAERINFMREHRNDARAVVENNKLIKAKEAAINEQIAYLFSLKMEA